MNDTPATEAALPTQAPAVAATAVNGSDDAA